MKQRTGRGHQGKEKRDLSNHVEILHPHPNESRLSVAAAQTFKSLHLNSQATFQAAIKIHSQDFFLLTVLYLSYSSLQPPTKGRKSEREQIKWVTQLLSPLGRFYALHNMDYEDQETLNTNSSDHQKHVCTRPRAWWDRNSINKSLQVPSLLSCILNLSQKRQ